MFKWVIAIAAFLFSGVIYAADASAKPWWDSIVESFLKSSPELNAWLIATLAFLSIFLRSLSEFMFFVASKTESKWDDELAQQIASVAKLVGKIFGWFGGGVPSALKGTKK